jgi:hypothetical protein
VIFTLVDYAQYCLKTGRYGDNQRDIGMRELAFIGEVPEDVVAELEPGDIIFTQRLDSALSWATMYFGSSPVDHVAVYVGDGKVLHQTITVSKVHALKALARGARVLVVKDGASVADGKSDGRLYGWWRKGWFHRLPPTSQLVVVAVEIVLGFYPESFRWKFLADVVLTCSIVDAVTFSLGNVLIALPVALGFCGIISANMASYAFKRRMGNPYPLLSHPDIGYRNFFRNGGRVVGRLGTLVVCEFGIVGYDLYLALRQHLRRGGPISSEQADDQRQEVGQFESSRENDTP